MSAQSIPPDEGLVLWQDESKVISLHEGSSPRNADFVFTSISNVRAALSTTANGVLTQHVLRALDVDALDVPMPVTLGEGFSVRSTPSGVSVVFVVTVTSEQGTETLLRVNLGRALRALCAPLAGKTIWLPLMGTGAGRLSMEFSLQITLETLLAPEHAHPGMNATSASPRIARETLLQRPSRFCIDLPVNLGPARLEKLRLYARYLLATRDSMYRREPWPRPMMRKPMEQPAETAAGAAPIQQRESGGATAYTSLIGAPEEIALVGLLSELFDDDGLRQWVRLALGREVFLALPGASVALDVLCFRLVLQVQQRGLIGEDFFVSLIEERPAQARRIREVAALWRNANHVRPSISRLSGVALLAERTSARPHYTDERNRVLGEQLADAYQRCRALATAGADTSAVVQDILRIKREIRSGGQLRPGDRLSDDRYLLFDQIGQGGFASVWKALDQTSGNLVAVKVLHSNHVGDVIRRERFFRGARIMAELEHPAVVRIVQRHGEDDGYHYFAMELMTGGDLRQAVLKGRVDASAVVPLLLRLGEALAKAHARRFIHRDIKPANVLLNERAEPRLTDFDLVAAADTTGGTQTGALGTFVYAAPEMLERPQDADARADVYGLGMTAAFVLHGVDLPRSVLRDAVGFIARLSCDEPLKRILQRAVAWEPEDRFADAAAFCEALRTEV
jgi:Protein kinase domain